MAEYNKHWDKRGEDEDPRWLPFLGIVFFAGVLAVAGAIVNLALAGIAKLREQT